MPADAPHRSAAILGKDYGLTAVEMNLLLKEEGLLSGKSGAWGLTDKGRQFARVSDVQRGPNARFDMTTWAPSVTDVIDVTDERRRQVQEAARVARQQQALARAAQAIDLDRARTDDAQAGHAGLDGRTVVAGLALAAVSCYAIYKVAPHAQALWTNKAAPRLRRMKNRLSDNAE